MPSDVRHTRPRCRSDIPPRSLQACSSLTDGDSDAPSSGKITRSMNFARGSGETNGVAPSGEYNYGVLPHVHLHVQPSVALHEADGVPFKWGLGDTEFGVKYRFIEQDKNSWAPSVAVFPLLEMPQATSLAGSAPAGPEPFYRYGFRRI